MEPLDGGHTDVARWAVRHAYHAWGVHYDGWEADPVRTPSLPFPPSFSLSHFEILIMDLCMRYVIWLCRQAVRAELISRGIIGDDAYVVIAGPANTYGHYVATREEYSIQRYEGASTLYGPCESESFLLPRSTLEFMY